MSLGTVPRSLVWATHLDVLPLDRIIERRDGYLVVRSPHNPGHYWGNLLLFDEPPAVGDRARWEQLFEAEFADVPGLEHRTFAWDMPDGSLGAARREFADSGYELEQDVGLVASGAELEPHPRANHRVSVRALDPSPGADEELWAGVVEIQVAGRGEAFVDEAIYRAFTVRRLEEQRELFRARAGTWYVALDGDAGVVGSCGIVVTGERARFQAVDTAESHRRQGICSRLVVDAAHHAASVYGAGQFVIAADAEYHALGLYESLGFRRRERVCGVFRRPR